jgi:hypothetical protein
MIVFCNANPPGTDWGLVVDILALFVQILGIYFVVISLRFVKNQIEMSEKIHADTLIWNKKIATENELSSKVNPAVTKLINESFDLKAHRILPLELVLSVIDEKKSIEGNIHHVLNRYERLGRGVMNGIYDEDIVKKAIRGPLLRTYYRYYEYIEHWKIKENKYAWVEFIRLAQKWELEEEYKENNYINEKLNTHFKGMNKFGSFEIESEQDKWYLLTYQDSKFLKDQLIQKYADVIVQVEGLTDNLVILGENHFGSLLVAYNEPNLTETYRLDIKPFNLSKTDLFVDYLLK